MNKFTGTFTAIITPFNGNLIDIEAFEKLINFQIEKNIDGIVIGGSTGELHTLTEAEYILLIKIAVKLAKNKILIIAGIGFNNTSTAVHYAQIAREYGAHAVMAVTPYYNKPTDEGLFLHFQEITQKSNLPLIVYTHPGRTGINVSDEMFIRLSNLPGVVAFKDGSSDIEKPLRLSGKLNNKPLLCGDDAIAVAYNLHGGQGIISVASNIIPEKVRTIQNLTLEFKFKEAITLHKYFFELYEALFVETNPIPIKYALYLMGFCQPNLRLPLVELTHQKREGFKAILTKFDLIK